MLKYHRLIIAFSLVFLALLAISPASEFIIWAVGLLIFIFISIIAIGAASMRYQIFVSAYTQAGIADKRIALTFDDGPGEKTTAVLALLQKYGAKATFFCIGKNAEKYPLVLKQIHEQGHIIGNHSYAHQHIFNLFGSQRMAREIDKTGTIIEKLIGAKPLLFRPPHGVTNPPTARAVRRLGLQVVGWSIRTYDTVRSVNETLIRKITAKIRPGSVILLHEHMESSEVLLEGILKFVAENDYACVGVDELFKIKAYAQA
ncbi:MAG: polysaccharide deacetylase family protein [Cyclobacteriaceae bacterium]|nr:polysaccharide deacetylase family protein [Cyclobacteriaceae bacterium]